MSRVSDHFYIPLAFTFHVSRNTVPSYAGTVTTCSKRSVRNDVPASSASIEATESERESSMTATAVDDDAGQRGVNGRTVVVRVDGVGDGERGRGAWGTAGKGPESRHGALITDL